MARTAMSIEEKARGAATHKVKEFVGVVRRFVDQDSHDEAVAVRDALHRFCTEAIAGPPDGKREFRSGDYDLYLILFMAAQNIEGQRGLVNTSLDELDD